jgi:hypothetical protein
MLLRLEKFLDMIFVIVIFFMDSGGDSLLFNLAPARPQGDFRFNPTNLKNNQKQ